MICPNCRKDVEGIWDEQYDGDVLFVCECCDYHLQTENAYEDYISEMKEESGRYRDDD